MSIIGTVSYGLCALAFLFLAALMLTSWRGGVHGVLLAGACLATAVWAGFLAWVPLDLSLPVIGVEMLELIRTGLWLVFLVWLLAPLRASNGLIRFLSILALAAPLLAMGLVLTQRLVLQPGIAPIAEGLHGLFILSGLALGLLGLVLLEQLYRNMPGERRWAMKFLCLGMAVIFGFDLYLYSDALLFRQLDNMVWQARGAVQALAVPLIAIAATRNRSWSLPVFVSRHVAFHTAAIVAAGGYLILISLGGYYIRDFGGSWGEFAQIVLIGAGSVVLVVFLASGDMRARLRVFLSKHFFSNKYDYREEWLRLTYSLADENDGLTPYQRAVRVAANIVGSPQGAVWLKREEGQYVPVGDWRLDVPADATLDGDSPLVRFLNESKWIVDVDELDREQERYNGLTLSEAMRRLGKPWVIIPLLHQESLTGFILLTRPDVNPGITWEDRDLLKTLGRQLAGYLGLHESVQALSQARQFEAFNQLTAFLMHDLKNLIAQQSLVVKNAEKHKHNPEFIDDAMSTIGNSVARMERLLEHLQRSQRKGIVQRVDIRHMLADATRRCADRRPQPELQVQGTDAYLEADPEELTMVVVHLIRNAQDATPDDGEVRVFAEIGETELTLTVQDSGEGMTPEFVRDELFKPFHTTKSSKGMGIGAHQVREFVRRMGGRVSVSSMPGEGTSFVISLPCRLENQVAAAPGNQGVLGRT